MTSDGDRCALIATVVVTAPPDGHREKILAPIRREAASGTCELLVLPGDAAPDTRPRVAEARGEIVIFLAPDLIAQPGLVGDHLCRHVGPIAAGAHCGQLTWDRRPRLLGQLLGPGTRAPLTPWDGRVPELRWPSDNWSVPRDALLRAVGADAHLESFACPGPRLGRRLAAGGIAAYPFKGARAHRCSELELEVLLKDTAAAVPELLALARETPLCLELRHWLRCRYERVSVLEAAESLVRSLWLRCQEVDALAPEGLLPYAGVGELTRTLRRAFLEIAVSRGLRDGCGPADLAEVPLPPIDDGERLLDLARLVALVSDAGSALGQGPLSHHLLDIYIRCLARHSDLGGELENRFAVRVSKELKRLRTERAPRVDSPDPAV